MEKTSRLIYVQPLAEMVAAQAEGVMVYTSPGVSNDDYDDDDPIDAHEGVLFGDGSLAIRDLWED